MEWSRWGRVAGATALFLCAVNAVAAAPLDVRYELDVALSPAAHTIGGVALVTVTNQSDASLGDIPLTLYPNHYGEADPALDRSRLEAIYPRTFNPGSTTITSIETEDGTPLEYERADDLGSHARTLARILLPRPLLSGRTIRLRIAFTTIIPEKFGVFGHFHGVTALKGGWHPYVPAFRGGEWAIDLLPDPAQFVIRLTAPRGVVVAGADIETSAPNGETDTWVHRSDRSATVALAFSPSYQPRVEQEGPTLVTYWFLPADRKYVGKVMDTLHHGLAFFRKEYGIDPGPGVTLAEAYLHQDLVSPHEQVTLVSTRLFKVFAPLKKYHEAGLVRGLFFALWRARLPDEETWVLEGLAEAGTQLYLRDRYRRPPNLLRLLKPFSFHPVVDQILYSKNLPLRQVYFKETTPIIPREDIALFNNQRPDGSTMLFKLTALLGEETVDTVFRRYVDLIRQGNPKPFREVVHEATNRDLDWFYRQWLSVNPSTDYAIASITQERRPDGYHTTLRLTKDGEGIEPLAIRLRQRDGPPLVTTWLSYERSFQETFVTPSPVTSVQLDPDHKTSDLQRYNDRRPPAIKFILEKFPGVGYDFQTKNLSYDFSTYFQRLYDDRNILRLTYAKDETSTSATLAFGHSYERRLFSADLPQSVTVGLSYNKQSVALFPDSSSTPFTAIHLTHTLSPRAAPRESPPDQAPAPRSDSPLIYSDQIQRLVFGVVPYSSLTTTFAQKIFGSEHPQALRLRLDLRRQWSFSRSHEIAGRAVLGESFGTFREERRFQLGGSGGMRGYSPSALYGESMTLGSIEYRYPLIHEMDVNIGGLAVLRRLQAAVFTDAGMVASHRNLVKFSQYLTDAGAGLRLALDALGLYPVVMRIDVAFPINTPLPDEQALHFYITAGQPF